MTYLSRQSVQSIPSISWRLLSKLIVSCIEFVQPSVTANIFNVADKRAPRLRQQNFVQVAVVVVPSMSEKDIDVKLMFSAITTRNDIKTTDT